MIYLVIICCLVLVRADMSLWLERFLVAKKLSPVKVGSKNGSFSEIYGSKYQT